MAEISNARNSKMYGNYCRFNSMGGEAGKCPNSRGYQALDTNRVRREHFLTKQ